MLEVVIRGGRAIMPHGSRRVDLGVGGGVIRAIAEAGELQAERVVDADGLIVFPGGVDPHVHVDTRFGEWTTTDDFDTATVPAAFGGTTSLVEFAIPQSGETAAEAVARRVREAAGAAVVDYGFHACVTSHRFEESLESLPALASEGVAAVKVFSTYRDTVGLGLGDIQRVLTACARTGQLVMVHPETDSLIEAGIAEQVRAGRLGPRGHAASRPALAEADAIRSIGDLAAAARTEVYFVHVSSAAALAALEEHRRRGRGFRAETVTPYLFLDESVYDRERGELWICSPPIRSSRDQEELWRAVRDAVFDVVATDHNCFETRQKLAHRGDFRRVPNGLPGVETRMPLLLGAAADGRLDWRLVARLSAENPSRIFGLWPRKGAIAVGADADLVLYDPAGITDLGRTHMATDYSPFEGFTATGRIVQTWVRGRCVVDGGELLVERGYGRPLVRGARES